MGSIFDLAELGTALLIGAVMAAVVYALRCTPWSEWRPLIWVPRSPLRAGLAGLSDEEQEIEKIKKITERSMAEAEDRSIAARLYRAGRYEREDRRRFLYLQILSLLVWPLVVYIMIPQVFLAHDITAVSAIGIAIFLGYSMPLAWLNRQIRLREEEILYYLPLVIEQISIGVSGSLDIGPCIAQIVETAHERSSHNPVTEMFVQVEKLMRSGLNLEDSLMEIANASGMEEVKHAFMFLLQCSKHGGEVSRQLQELADAVTVQRQLSVEDKITALPVKATGPLTVVFAGFFGLLFAGLFARLALAFT